MLWCGSTKSVQECVISTVLSDILTTNVWFIEHDSYHTLSIIGLSKLAFKGLALLNVGDKNEDVGQVLGSPNLNFMQILCV